MSKSQINVGRVSDQVDYWVGFGAYRTGTGVLANPHALGTPERESWFVGWVEARVEGRLSAPKSLFASKLFWLGIFQILLSAAAYWQLTTANQQTAAIVGAGSGLLVIIFRAITNQAVFLGRQPGSYGWGGSYQGFGNNSSGPPVINPSDLRGD